MVHLCKISLQNGLIWFVEAESTQAFKNLIKLPHLFFLGLFILLFVGKEKL